MYAILQNDSSHQCLYFDAQADVGQGGLSHVLVAGCPLACAADLECFSTGAFEVTFGDGERGRSGRVLFW